MNFGGQSSSYADHDRRYKYKNSYGPDLQIYLLQMLESDKNMETSTLKASDESPPNLFTPPSQISCNNLLFSLSPKFAT